MNPKCTVDEALIDKIVLPMDKMAQSYGKYTFKHASLVSVGADDTIEVRNARDGSLETIKFDYLIITTGFTYREPFKDASATTIGQRKEHMKEFLKKVDDAPSVLVGGAGILGVELVSEIAVKHGKSKKIGICLRGDRLLPGLPPKVGVLATQWL